MLEEAEQHVGDLKELLKTPTPENFEVANQKLTAIYAALQSFASEPSAKDKHSAQDAAFLSRIRSEMTHIHSLFKGPVDYLEGLARFRMQRFGSYTRDGHMECLGQESSARTITHL